MLSDRAARKQDEATYRDGKKGERPGNSHKPSSDLRACTRLTLYCSECPVICLQYEAMPQHAFRHSPRKWYVCCCLRKAHASCASREGDTHTLKDSLTNVSKRKVSFSSSRAFSDPLFCPGLIKQAGSLRPELKRSYTTLRTYVTGLGECSSEKQVSAGWANNFSTALRASVVAGRPFISTRAFNIEFVPNNTMTRFRFFEFPGLCADIA